MEVKNEKYRALIDAERDRLLLLTPAEVDKLSHSDQYQRMRYEREIEGNEYVWLLRRGMDRDQAAKTAKENANRIVANWKAGQSP